MCFPQCWYLANDFQLFLILPWLILIYKLNRTIGYIFMLLVFGTFTALSMIISIKYDLGPALQPYLVSIFSQSLFLTYIG